MKTVFPLMNLERYWYYVKMRPIYCYYGPGPSGFANAGQELYH